MNQKLSVINHLKKYGSLTSWQAITKYRITRLSEYIRQLRREDGYDIKSIVVKKEGKHWVKYVI